MSDLADFLLARIAEDEAEAPTPSMPWDDGTCGDCGGRGADRVLAECEAKRRIVAEHAEIEALLGLDSGYCRTCTDWAQAGHDGPPLPRQPCPTLRLLALPYADHPDYRDEWRP